MADAHGVEHLGVHAAGLHNAAEDLPFHAAAEGDHAHPAVVAFQLDAFPDHVDLDVKNQFSIHGERPS